MTSKELREKFITFFTTKTHAAISSASLLPENDPTVLFTTAGMHPLVPFLMGEKHPGGVRLTNAQKCIRTDDINEVGDPCHHTFFEMMGNWSLGDYFKKEAIGWSLEFLTGKEWLNISKDRLAVSVFVGDDDAPFDQESYQIWLDLGIDPLRIAKLPKKNNWWGPAGETGPCGPDTEMFVWTGDQPAPQDFSATCDNPLWVEIWNDVFMQYNKVKAVDGVYRFEKLEQHNVDTGMGLERALAITNDLVDNYQTDLFLPIIEKIEEMSDKKYQDYLVEFRIIADHIKAAVFAINDGAMPSNKGAGYIVRRFIRRAVIKGQQLGIADNFIVNFVDIVQLIYENVYKLDVATIKQELDKEETKFRKTLKEGLKQLNCFVSENHDQLNGVALFTLSTSYGFPLELSLEIAKEQNIQVQENAIVVFEEQMRKHQELSRTASAGMFKGGLADASDQTKKLHTAAHLMLAALREVLGQHVSQRGANITPERLRFDFSHPEKLTIEQIERVQEIVNDQIIKNEPVICCEMPIDQAEKEGAVGVFKDKYAEMVKVYSIGGFSKEICGGPHVDNTSQLGKFKIIKEESCSSGVRRIKAILEGK